MDITVTTKDPRVWGETPQGFIREGRVWRKGIITTCRQILDVSDPAHTIIIGSGCQQRVDFFQTTFLCNDRRPFDPFLYDTDMGIVDSVEMIINVGPAWPTLCDTGSDLQPTLSGNPETYNAGVVRKVFPEPCTPTDAEWSELLGTGTGP